MGKRKKSDPTRADEEKRRCLTWNMLDRVSERGSLLICSDNDSVPQHAQELENNGQNSSQHVDEECTLSQDMENLSDVQTVLHSYLNNCLFWLTVRNKLILKPHEWHKQITSFSVKVTEDRPRFDLTDAFLDKTGEFWLYIGDNDGESFIYVEEDNMSCDQKSVKFWCIKTDIPLEVLEAFQEEKIFQLVLNRYDPVTQSIDINVYLRQAALVNLNFACEPIKTKKHSSVIQKVIGQLFGIEHHVHSGDFTKNHDIEDLYLAVKEYHGNRKHKSLYEGETTLGIQHPSLIPQLRPYQKEAVQWMIEQESDIGSTKDNDLHMLYKLIQLPDGTELYYNQIVGSLTVKRFGVKKRLPGGILADEMGLGKTVEVLACMMLHPRNDMMDGKTIEKESLSAIEELENDTDNQKVEKYVCDEMTHKSDTETKYINDSVTASTSVGNEDDITTNISSGYPRSDHEMTCELESSKRSVIVNPTEVRNLSSTGNFTTKSNSRAESNDVQNNAEISNTTKVDNREESATSCELVPGTSDLNGSKMGTRNKMNGKVFQQKHNNFFQNNVGSKEIFECICGAKYSDTQTIDRNPIQCIKCGLWQHAECVNFNLENPSRPDFMCPHCLVRNTPLKSGATLIISPSSICYQWVDEIKKHIKNQALKVYVYTGVNKQGFIQPSTLASQDIVITSYETLRKEIDYVDLPHSNSENGRKFRHPKRFMATPSPLIAVEWWRICLDEAQMVESASTKTAFMALRLTAVNRWCVTGTPIQKSIEDLYGLFLFLGLDPFWVKQWFDKMLCTPLCYGIKEPMYEAVSSVLWRTAKKDVIEQINIPAQTDHVHWLTFSPVEDHFYRRQYHDCVKDCMKKLSKWTDMSTKLGSLDKYTVTQLLFPLLRLRQACCHPQAVRGEFLPLQKSTMTMEELLESLTKKVKTECEEAHRQIVAALNGQAGIYIIKGEYIEAVDKYREVMMSVEEHKEQLRTDELQQLHALHNLQEIIQLKPEGLVPTLRDGQLYQQTEDIKHRYMTKAETKVTVAKQHLIPLQNNLHQLTNEFSQGSEWWLEIVDHAVDRQIDGELIYHIKTELSYNVGDIGPHISIANMFNDTRGLQLVVEQRLQDLESTHQKLKTSLNELSQGLTPAVIHATVECCLRPIGKVNEKCKFCQIDSMFQKYESKLYSFTEQGLVVSGDQYQVGTRRQGTWADSQLEKSLKAVISFARQHRFDRDMIEFGTIHIKVLDGMKKEFKGLRAVWMSLREQVSSVDELEMAATRLRLRFPDEPEPTTSQFNIIEPGTLDHHIQKLKSDQVVGKCELRKKLGQLLYLTNLAKTQNETVDKRNPEPCPICQRELGVEWSVMHCGHCYCLDCISILLDQFSFGGRNRVVKCAICREKTYRSDISYVSTKKSDDSDEELNFNIKGSHSSKIKGIVKQMIKIHLKDPTAKILVFSTWIDVLNVLDTALTENNIEHRILSHGVKFQQNLSQFKEDKALTALLMPIQSGANGLNLIEATYVILVEPILNPAQELQAIGRVHRIGQTKPTEVHRFLIRGTIEQKMHSMLNSIKSCQSSHDTEENCLTIGDLTSLLSAENREQDNSEEPNQNVSENATEEPMENIIERNEGPVENVIERNEEPVENVIERNEEPLENVIEINEESAENVVEIDEEPVENVMEIEESVETIIEMHAESVENIIEINEEPVENISKIDEESVENLSEIDEESVENLSEIHEESVENLSEIDEESVENLSEIDEEPVENNIEIDEEPVENIIEIEEESVENIIEINEEPVENVFGRNKDPVENIIEINEESVENIIEINEEPVENIIEEVNENVAGINEDPMDMVKMEFK